MNLETVIKHKNDILQIATSCKASNIRVFGSVAKGLETNGSDVDFLVSFNQDASLLDHSRLCVELEELLGIKVDVVSDKSIKTALKEDIISESISI